ncbi:MAG TPA: S41 family peptidase [Bryobacteraceae bacterium]|nr:S41 family peptidase [Bryobacteraceae bacterium]
MPSDRRSFLFIPAFIAICSLIIGALGGGRVTAATNPEDSIGASMKAFTRVYDVVEQNFADPVKADKAIYKGGIPGMLRELDPHSNFFDPKDYRALREEQVGHYAGVGMSVQSHTGKTVVLAPFVGSPAYKAGLRPGDVILEVNDKKTENLNTTEVADLLKGPKGTKVQIKVAREGSDQPVIFNIIRDVIPRYSVPDSFWLKPGIAYIKIDQFNENTSKEMEEKLKRLGEKNIQGLVLDLRDNPGGLLNEGVDVTGHFLRRNEVVVSHRGRAANSNKTYTARNDNGGRTYPIVVVVNRYTASAAEIVSGALQDHDRGWILGETTFGKGLVQTVYPLGENTALALTTAHYYTPSGRLIQRDYSNISFLDYYSHTNLDQKNTQDVKMTDSGRTVYGGGGITPDEKYTATKYNKFQTEVLRKYALYNFSAKFFGARQDTKLPKGWEPDDKMVDDFRSFLGQNKIEFTEADFSTNREWVRQQLKREIYITAFGVDESRQVAVEQDPEVQQAIASMTRAKALLDAAKKMMVERLRQPEPVQLRADQD